jgi:REP element-mobilizing transposase RayT
MDDVRDRIPRGGRLWVALVTRRRRPLFVETEVRERVEAAVRAAVEAAGWRVVCCEVWPAEVRVCVELSPGLVADELVSQVRAAAAGALAEGRRQADEAFARQAVVAEGSLAGITRHKPGTGAT